MPLKKLLAATKSLIAGRIHETVEYPLETERELTELHSRAPVDRHLDILFKGVSIGGVSFTDLYWRCLKLTGTVVTPYTVFHRFQSRFNLLQYFVATLPLTGARTECGVYRGATSLLLCHAWRNRQADFKGDDFYLIDSFSGNSASGARDLIPVKNAEGATQMQPFFPVGKTDVTPGLVRSFFDDFPNVQICAGWVPQVFATLPERNWSFVHLDLTLFDPTLAALEYFYPRLSKGGVIVCDGSIFCPGVRTAVDIFGATHGIAFVILSNREFIVIKQ